jgi:DinB superfamily
MAVNWTEQLNEQLTWHWENHLRPRLEGLDDNEYLWEPVAGCWNVHPQADGSATIDFEFPEPDPPPVTTIAWRLGHVIVGIFGVRNASHFGGPPMDYQTFPWASTAKEALEQLDAGYERWLQGVAGLDEDRLADPVGPAEGPFAEHPYAALVLHINREAIHHGAEILLLRDLYRREAR